MHKKQRDKVMKDNKAVLAALWRDEAGLTTVEYAIAGGLISAAVVGAFIALGGSVNTIITFLNTQLGLSPALAGGG
jgi:pilus assembly protein Flp/PilA